MSTLEQQFEEQEKVRQDSETRKNRVEQGLPEREPEPPKPETLREQLERFLKLAEKLADHKKELEAYQTILELNSSVTQFMKDMAAKIDDSNKQIVDYISESRAVLKKEEEVLDKLNQYLDKWG